MKRILLFIVCILAGLVFINAGLDKFLHYMPIPKDLPEKLVKAGAAFAGIGWLMPLVGAVEIAGGLLIIFDRTRALGAIIILPVLTGIFLATANTAPSSLPVVIALAAVILWIIIDNRKKYLYLINRSN
ncbi:MAG: DoxX family membrane protein [Bacteroidota bacterium]|nr:DoxX family membrane protein [Bacteroidota bacterium]MDP4216176.1 DoxX family membrane protein [Bacteroidota bacterium]MDP4247050.1 DoxX family membrane protein [Bacteroidota bacterium]MDP4255100.1 DoxX family membrane protein [Bacteroidota bacterium]MDP4258332.1 DoxX family membrane protein [Bacteroidota bacterium]